MYLLYIVNSIYPIANITKQCIPACFAVTQEKLLMVVGAGVCETDKHLESTMNQSDGFSQAYRSYYTVISVSRYTSNSKTQKAISGPWFIDWTLTLTPASWTDGFLGIYEAIQMRKGSRTTGTAEDVVRAPAKRSRHAPSIAVALATHRLSKSLRAVLQNWWRDKEDTNRRQRCQSWC